MGHPAAILETTVLAKRSYVVVCIVDKRRLLSLYGCYFLIYVIRRPCSLDNPAISGEGNSSIYDSRNGVFAQVRFKCTCFWDFSISGIVGLPESVMTGVTLVLCVVIIFFTLRD